MSLGQSRTHLVVHAVIAVQKLPDYIQLHYINPTDNIININIENQFESFTNRENICKHCIYF